jgi:SAM-dependent methyltransferase
VLSITEQIAQGRLVCPVSHQRLLAANEALVTLDGERTYPVRDGVPILIADPARQAGYRQEAAGQMYEEYLSRRPATIKQTFARLIRPGSDYRSVAAEKAFLAITAAQPPSSLCLSIGGGPTRPHESLTNLNIDLFANVDVVGDTYGLPYADDSVDTIHCEAVLEHLAEPSRALQEMRRVLRPGGLGYFATPFLQAYHAYPNHYQNYTLEGHNHLLRSNDFRVLDAGTCVGPTFMILDLVSLYLRNCIPSKFLARAATAAALLLTRPLRPLDRWINQSPQASILASTVYALVEKA